MAHASVDIEAVYGVASAIANSAGRGIDVSAAKALGLFDEIANAGDVERLARRLEHAIDGATTGECLAFLKKRHPAGYHCDDVGLALLRHAGVPPEVAAAIAIMADDLCVDPIHFEATTAEGRVVGFITDHLDDGMLVEGDLAPDMAVTWRAPMVVIRTALPDTIAAAVAGRPLANVVSHAALDGMALTVLSAKPGKTGGTVLEVEGHARRDLFAMSLEMA